MQAVRKFVVLRPNVEVTGAARLYRAASGWTAGLGRDAHNAQHDGVLRKVKPQTWSR